MIQRRAITGVVLAAAILALSGCGLEVKEETTRETSPIQATNVSIGSVDIRDAFVTYDDNTGIQPLATTPPGVPGAGSGSGYLVVTMVNNGRKRDQFTGVTSPLGTVTMEPNPQQIGPVNPSSTVTLLPGVPVAFGAPSLGSTGQTLLINGSTPAAVGTDVQVQFSFTNSGTSTVQVPVVQGQDVTVNPTQVVPTPTTTETLPSEGLKPASD